ncbi:hypothetical protein [Bifidobacterium favimelis]|uniref:Uncharacterized protein n=1 Tax=Bifidobacterium favimelis TaxID=3122979 RepID=A0ABU8ZRM9_9BIFI
MHYFTPRRCPGSAKIMYHDQAKAAKAAERSYIERGTRLWVYRCGICGSWHLTSHDPSLYDPAIREGGRRAKPRSRKRGYKPRRR